MMYDYEIMRRKAFVVCNNKKYEGDLHFDCLMEAIKDQVGEDKFEDNYDKYFNMEEVELNNIIGGSTIGEIANINNKNVIVYYDKKDESIIKKFFDLHLCMCENGIINPIN